MNFRCEAVGWRYVVNRTTRQNPNYHIDVVGNRYIPCKCGWYIAVEFRSCGAWKNNPFKVNIRRKIKLSNKKSMWRIKMNCDPEWRKCRKERWDDV